MLSYLFLLLALCVHQLVAVGLVVDLGYAKYRGNETAKGVIRWAGMRYARSPSRIDGMRFTAPQDPLPIKGIVNATEYGALCISTGADLQYEFGEKWSEDCLFANVFAPANATTKSKLPVFVFIQGGGFNANSNANFNGTKLIHAAEEQMVVVNFGYRVGPYGFLASQDITGDKTLSVNNGLKDQRQLLKWVKDHIEQFGGDPDHVTLGGASAGGGSVVMQLTAYGGRDDKLFHAAAVESPATPPLRTVNESNFAYNSLLKQAGCQDLACLRSVDAVKFQAAVRSTKLTFPGGKNPPVYFWNPVVDDDFIGDYIYNEFKNNRFLKVPTIFGDVTNEGTIFTSDALTSQEKAYTFVSDQFPNLNRKNQKAIQQVWPGPPDLQKDTRWRKVASDVYGHIRYQCPCLNFSSSYADNNTNPTWQYRWNVGTALHVAEMGPIWNNGTSAAAVFIQAYWASFIRSYDPNKYPAEYLADGVKSTSPDWETFGEGNGKRMLFNDKNEVKIEDVSDQEWAQCNVVSGMGLQLNQVISAKSTGYRFAPLTWVTALTHLVVVLGALQWLYP